MRDRFRFARCMIPLNIQTLQTFAEGDGGGAGGDGGGSGSGGSGGTGGGGSGSDGGTGDGGSEGLSFDDFLKSGTNQAEFDRRVQKAINTAVTKAQEKWQALTDDKLTEAEKLAKMTKEEQAKYLAAKRAKELDDRENAITKRELQATAKNTLAEKGLPIELAEILVYTDADACSESIESVGKVFRAAVEKAVEEKLKGGNPPKRGQNDQVTAEQIEKYMMGGM